MNLLREHGVALVCADTVKWPRLMDLTSDFVYCRLHGAKELYRSQYDEHDLTRWAGRINAWRAGKAQRDGAFAGEAGHDAPRDVFVFFDNTDKLHAPDNARRLMEMLRVDWDGTDTETAA